MEKNFNEEEKSKKLDEYINRIILEQEKHTNDRKSLFSNYDYANWLIQFTTLYNDFTDISWKNSKEDLSLEEKNNVSKLPLFYEGIKLYADNNYLYPKCENGTISYRIKVGDYGFEIGMIMGEDITYYCSRTELEDISRYIDIVDIVTNKKQDIVDAITSILNNLSDCIDSVYNQGVPIEAINQLLRKKMEQLTYRDIITNSSNKQK